MRCGLIGYGSIGSRHLRNLQHLGIHEIGVQVRSPMAAEAAKRAGAAYVFSRIEDLFERSPEFVVIANSTSQHCTALQAAIAAGSHVFVEKPISHTLDGLSIALDQASAKKLIVGVGVNLRFHPVIETVRQLAHSSTLGSLVCARAEIGHYLPEWHPGRDYRKEYSALSSGGGGAMLTLIHEVDYLTWTSGALMRVEGRRGHRTSLEIDTDDICDLLIEHEGGVWSTAHMDFLDRSYNRRARWVFEEGSLEWRMGRGLWQECGRKAEQLVDDSGFDLNTTYIRELEDFLSAIEESRPPRCTGFESALILQRLSGIQMEGNKL